MSSDTLPISPTRFATALKDLPLETLHFKGAEIRNSIAHLDYSNEQLRPFANGSELSTNGVPDQDCVDAIRENEIVIARMERRIALLKAEVEERGSSWLEFRSAEEGEAKEEEGEERENLVNGDGETGRSEAWRDGTFQTGRIVNGEVRMDGDGASNETANSTANGTAGGRLGDEALRRAMEERMRALAEDEDEGMHL
ncbi:hypothetical protein BJ875DRAFT_467782 [Amylocarpus encephaloides]|uniref:Uncharacterized protein n=1 Tax=Amylocarpus encephaloides TaxID=45428 RepID=A0A9P7YFK8_9HELO|nr:hypothetical protein BJ875DRAFT_467782 [Amylocarpus encephaloides]